MQEEEWAIIPGVGCEEATANGAVSNSLKL
jgi:hypothetical protein